MSEAIRARTRAPAREANHSQPDRGLEALLAALCVASALVWCCARIDTWTVRLLGDALARRIGMPVTIASVGPRWPFGAALDGIRVGRLLSVERLEVQLHPRALLRSWPPGPRHVRSVRIVRPTLQLTAQRSVLASSRRAAATEPPPLRGVRLGEIAAQLPRLRVEDGRITASLELAGHRVALRATAIHLRHERPGSGLRLVSGPLQLGIDRAVKVSLDSAAVDLDARLQVQRAALLSGRLLHPPSGAALRILRAELRTPARDPSHHRAATNRSHLLSWSASSPGTGGGKLDGSMALRARLGGSDRIALEPLQMRLRMRDLSLAGLAPLLERVGVAPGSLHVSGRVELQRTARGVRTALDLHAGGLRVAHARIARRTVGPFSGHLRGHLTAAVEGSAIELSGAELHAALGKLRATVRGAIELGPGTRRIALDAEIPAVGCGSALASLPHRLAPALRGMTLSGQIGGRAHLVVDPRHPRAETVELELSPMSCHVITDPPAADVHRLRGPIAVRVAGPSGQVRRWRVGPANPSFRRFHRISPLIRNAFVAAEDTAFFHHRGFDTSQLKRAVLDSLREGGALRGASTISQQLVKNVFLTHDRTIARKLQEAVLTWRMEQVVSKRRILELYLNLVELGPGVHGVQAASRRYFGKSAAAVDPLQAVHLAALIPSPRPLAQRFARARPGPSWMRRLRLLLRLMRRNGGLTREQARYWAARPLYLKTPRAR